MDLQSFIRPRSIAMIGASSDPKSISGRPLRLLQQHGYKGAVYPINPKYQELNGLPCYPAIGAVPGPVDLALVSIPARSVAGALAECAAAGVAHAMVFSSGFGEAGEAGKALQDEVRRLKDGTAMRICGPNSEGYFNVIDGIPAGFSPAIDYERGLKQSRPGPIGIVAQSGGLGFALFNRGLEQGLGFSQVISTGNEVDLESIDYLDFLVDDPDTKVILAFIEQFRAGRRLAAVARKAAAAGKPIIVAKVGRSEAGRRAAASHTGSLAGADEAWDAAFRQLGIIRADDVDEMLDLAAYFSQGRLPAGRRVGIVTVSGGSGAWLADACAVRGLELPEAEAAVQDGMRPLIPAYGTAANPIDVTAQGVSTGGVEKALELLGQSPNFDAIAMIASLAADESFIEALPRIRQLVAATDKAVVYFSYTTPTPRAVAALAELSVPCYPTPGRTARALGWAAWYRSFLDRQREVAVFAPQEAAPAVALPGRPLSETEARAFLAPCGLRAPREGLARSAADAAGLLRDLGGPVVMKVVSPQILHKTDAGGVRLGVASEAQAGEAYDSILAAVRSRHPEAEIQGVLVQEQIQGGVELILGARLDAGPGPLIMLGLGGIYVEVFKDVTFRIAPVSPGEARAMIDEVRGAALLRGVRGQPAADTGALAQAIVRFSQFVAALPPSAGGIDINPLVVLPEGQGVVMVDAALDLPTP